MNTTSLKGILLVLKSISIKAFLPSAAQGSTPPPKKNWTQNQVAKTKQDQIYRSISEAESTTQKTRLRTSTTTTKAIRLLEKPGWQFRDQQTSKDQESLRLLPLPRSCSPKGKGIQSKVWVGNQHALEGI